MLLSLVVPVLNEEAAIRPFVERLREVMTPLGPEVTCEIVFVNDGSRDATEAVIFGLAQRDPAITLVNLSRTFGKEAALAAGIAQAQGDAVIPMDVDLQDPPEVIPDMLALWRKGAKVVNARRIRREADGWLKRSTSAAFYRVFNALSETAMPPGVGDFRLLDREVVEVFRRLGERSRLNKALFSWVGFETAEVTYERPARATGRTAWSYWRLWKLALDGLLSSSTVPLRMWVYVGSGLALLAFAYSAVILLRTLFFGTDMPGYASTVILILSFGGLNLLVLGIIGEYVGRIYTEVRGRPLYVIRSVETGGKAKD